MKNLYELKDLLSQLDGSGYFIDFITTKGIQAGIIRLHANEKDTQEPHSVDEVYYVIEGSGLIILRGESHPIKQGTCIFVPGGMEHRFYGNAQDLLIFYALGR
jgi:mannose-6-phosphate isomerase-like protein (cupin superfamily)